MIAGACVLVVDDDKAVRNALKINLSKNGLEVLLATTAKEALQMLHRHPVELMLTDVQMPGITGLQLLEQVRSTWPHIAVVVMTGYGSVRDAVDVMKTGASDYIIKPIQKDELLLIIERALESKALKAELVKLRREVVDRYGFENIIGTSSIMVDLYEQIAAVAETRAAVLLQGPTGTGKELLAHAIHYRSSRAQSPFIRINCAAIPDTLLESELFGHERGAFSGAIRQHRGKFEQADGGTILLDEIGEIEPHVQVKLLRILENGELSRVGSDHIVQVDVRILSATNKDLAAEVAEKRFRQDLYYRLNVMKILVPSLADRKEDIPLLVDHFKQKFCARENRGDLTITKATMATLVNYPWPGNVRELEHTIERAVVLSKGDQLDIALPNRTDTPVIAEPSTETPMDLSLGLQATLHSVERQMVLAALHQGKGVQAEAARILGISRSNLNYRINKLGIKVAEVRFV